MRFSAEAAPEAPAAEETKPAEEAAAPAPEAAAPAAEEAAPAAETAPAGLLISLLCVFFSLTLLERAVCLRS